MVRRKSIQPALQSIISCVHGALPSEWQRAFIGCFYDGEKDNFIVRFQSKGIIFLEEMEAPKKVQDQITELRKDCWLHGDHWQMAVFGMAEEEGIINVYLDEEVDMNDWMSKAELT